MSTFATILQQFKSILLGDYADIGLVIVLFNPSQEEKARILRVSRLVRGVVVDNSANRSFADDVIGRMEYVSLGHNSGIAYAQNVGMRRLLADKAVQYVLLFDQDSNYPDDFPLLMRAEMERILAFQPQLAALGPQVVNKSTGEEYGSVLHKRPTEQEGFLPFSEVIASGCLLRREALEAVGLNDERLFIDFVDCEWCWRARSKGYVVGLTERVQLAHQVGQRQLHLGRHIIIVSAPFRYYYQYRNLLWLMRRGYVPLRFKFFKGIKALLRFIYFPFVVADGRAIWKQMWRGVKDGLRPCPSTNK